MVFWVMCATQLQLISDICLLPYFATVCSMCPFLKVQCIGVQIVNAVFPGILTYTFRSQTNNLCDQNLVIVTTATIFKIVYHILFIKLKA